MPAPDFLDTNILIYAYDDSSDTRKQELARELIRRAIGGDAVVSSQVLAEFAATLLHKMTPPASAQEVAAILDALNPIRTLPTDFEMIRRATEVHGKYKLHIYDALILAAAERAGAERVLSEDLNAGQRYVGVRVENPFA